MDDLTVFKTIAKQFSDKMPFCQFLGFEVDKIREDCVTLIFPTKPEFIGNHIQQSLHGGVISGILDTAGAIMAMVGVITKSPELLQGKINDLISHSGTLDLRVDYLRPGKGKYFRADARLMRCGNRVSVTRMELHNNEDVLIAVGTGTYIIGT